MPPNYARPLGNLGEFLETMIVGTVLGDALLSALRRIAHAEISGRTFKAQERERSEGDDA